jgi:hypothetical protein
MRKLHLSPDLALPLEAVTQKFAFLGRSGSGKSYASGKLTEELLDAGAQVVIVDQIGIWYGLRLAADGKSPGISIPVFGGPHGDIPLEPSAGALIAELIADKGISVILDISEFIVTEQRRFVTAFATALLHAKKRSRSPVMLVWEECQDWVPEKTPKDGTHMVSAMQRLIKQGRNFGIGTTLISQRPQAVAKDVLNQTEALFVFQNSGKHERRAIEQWIVDKGLDDEVMAELPTLQQGEAFVWSPQWLQLFKRIAIGKKRTYDASRTPEFGAIERARPLAPVDLKAISEQMKATIERAKQTDPKELQKQIADLKKQVAAKAPAPVDPQAVDRAVKKAVHEREAAWRKNVLELERQIHQLQIKLHKIAGIAGEPGASKVGEPARVQTASQPARTFPTYPSNNHVEAHPRPVQASVSTADREGLGKGERQILIACAQHPHGCTMEQLTVLTGYKRSSRNSYLQRLRQQGLVETSGDSARATQVGIDALGSDYEPLPTGTALRDYWLQRLSEGERRCLQVLLDSYPDEVQRPAIDEVTGYKRSSRNTYLQRLSARQLIQVGPGDAVAAVGALFD